MSTEKITTAQPNEILAMNNSNEEAAAKQQQPTPTVPPEAFLTQLAFGAMMTQALHVAA